MAPEGRFALEQADFVCNQKCFMVTGKNLHYLCAVLNSSLVTWFVRRIAVTTGMGLTQWDKFTVERVPVARPNRLSPDRLGELVESMLTAVGADDRPEISNLQNAIDHQVFTLYNLTPAEIEYVSRLQRD